MKVVVFDLDDTLIKYSRKKICIPKQTYHILRLLKHKQFLIYIITYNPYGEFIVAQFGLFKYIEKVVYGICYRDELIRNIVQPSACFFYFDDRLDNISSIQATFPNSFCVQVPTSLMLHTLVKTYVFKNIKIPILNE